MIRTMINLVASAVAFGFVLAAFVGCNLGGEQRAKVSLRTFPSGDGWGYEIRLEDKCLIYQSMIPAIDSLRPFPSEQSARRVGRLVLKRVVSGEPFSVTVKEVEDALKE